MEPPGRRYIVRIEESSGFTAADVYLADPSDPGQVDDAVRAAVARTTGRVPGAVQRASSAAAGADPAVGRFTVDTDSGQVVVVVQPG